MSNTTGRGGVAGSSALMFSGTLVSRLLGMIRSPLLLGAAIGANLGASDAFAVANKLPNVVYLLIAGGVLNAILVPALVRAMAKDDDGGQTYANRLITVFGVGLAAVTLLLTVGAQLLVYLYAGAMPSEWFDIAVAFAWWTVPQLFFYGMYTMLGQVLNARGIFGPYMWAPALNNVVAIAGLLVYLGVYGTAGESAAADPSTWTPGRIALVAGTATLGIVAQAAILFVPLWRSGFRYRFDFTLRGSGLGRASRTAMWVFGAVLVGQVSNILVSQAAAGARGDAAAAGVDPLAVAGNQAYDNAYLLYSLPTSLVVVSLVTALFTRMSTNAATGEVAKVRDDTSLALRVVGLFTVFVAPAMIVLALPLTRILNAAVTYTEVRSIATVLACMLVGLVAVGAWTVLQRVYYAFEAARHLFWIQLPTVAVLAAGAILAMTLPPTWTVPTIGLAMAASNSLGVVLAYVQLRRYIPDIDAPVVARAHGRIALAAAVPVLAGWGLLHLLGTGPEMGVGGAIWRTLLVGAVMVALYLLALRLFKVRELAIVTGPLLLLAAGVGRRVPGAPGRWLARLGGGGVAAAAASAPSGTTAAASSPEPGDSGDTLGGIVSGRVPDEPETGDAAPGKEAVPPVANVTSGDAGAHTAQRLAELCLPEDAPLIAGRYLLDGYPDPAPDLPGEPAEDLILGRSVRVLRLDPASPRTVAVLDAARRAALVRDDRLLALLDVGQDSADAWIVTEEIPGTGLDELVTEGPLTVEDARAVIGEAASGLEAATRLGVHHLVLEPQSVRVTRDGEVIVVGLGIIAALGGSPHGEDPSDLDVIAAARADGTDLVRLAHLALTGTLPARGAEVDVLDYPEETPEAVRTLAERTLRGGQPPVGPGTVIRAFAPWTPVAPAPDAGAQRKGRRRAGGLLAAAFAKRTEAQRAAHPQPPEVHDPADEAPAAGTAAGAAAGTGAAAVVGAAASAPAASAEPAEAAAPTAPGAPDGPVAQRASHSVVDRVGPADETVVLPAVSAAEEPGPVEAVEPVAPAGDATVVAPAVGARAFDQGAAEEALSADGAAEPTTPAEPTTRAEQPAGTADIEEPADPDHPTHSAGERAASHEDSALALVGPFATEPAESAEVPPRQSRTVLGIVAGLVLVGLIAAIVVLVSPLGDGRFSRAPAPSPEASAEAPAQEQPAEETPEPTPTAEPVITELDLVDPEQRYPDHPEDLGLAMDGSPNTAWRTLWYNSAAFGNTKPGVGIVVTLEEPAMVSSVTLDVAGTGGHVAVLDGEPGAADTTELGESTLGRDTTITFDEPSELSELVVWFDELPTATENGRYMIALHELAIG